MSHNELPSASSHLKKASAMIRRHPDEIHAEDGAVLHMIADKIDDLVALLDEFIV